MHVRTLNIAEFDADKLSMTNFQVLDHEERKNVWFAYPRWIKGANKIVYHAPGKLFLYQLSDGSTREFPNDNKADYRYLYGEATLK